MSETTSTEQPKRLQCRHIFTNGQRCGAACLRNEHLCYYHHTSRGRAARLRHSLNESSDSNQNPSFELPLPEDRSAIQASIGLVLQRIASNQLDPRRAGLLLYGLQIASLNLPKEHQDPDRIAQPPIDEVVVHPELGPIAPEAELPPPHRTSREQLCDWRERNLAEREKNLDEREAKLRLAEPREPPKPPAVHKPVEIPPSCFAPPGWKPAIVPDIKAVAHFSPASTVLHSQPCGHSERSEEPPHFAYSPQTLGCPASASRSEESANGAPYTSMGHSPMNRAIENHKGLKARSINHRRQ